MEKNAKRRKHKHKESYSILLISDTGQGNRSFHISRGSVRLFLVCLLLGCIVVGWLVYQFAAGSGKRQNLRDQLAAQEQLVAQLRTEKENLDNEKQALAAEIETLHQAAEAGKEDGEVETGSAIPSRFPCVGGGVLTARYAEEKPSLTIKASKGSRIIAAGDGTVTFAGSNATYRQIIEVKHGSRYKTRYLCRKEAKLRVKEGDQVKAGGRLLSITQNNTMVDYQMIFENHPIDPLTMIDAKG